MEPTFKVGDRVTGTGNPFWMTVREVLPHGLLDEPARYRCTFGAVGGDAGTWADSALAPYVAAPAEAVQ